MTYTYKLLFTSIISSILIGCSSNSNQTEANAPYLKTLSAYDLAMSNKNVDKALSFLASTASVTTKLCNKKIKTRSAISFGSLLENTMPKIDVYERTREITDLTLNDSELIITSVLTERAVIKAAKYDKKISEQNTTTIAKTSKGYQIISINAVEQCS